MQDRRRGHRSRAGEHQANGGDRSRSRRRGTRREARAESGQRLSGEAIGNLECEARVRVRGGPQRRLPFISRGGAGEGACWASQWAVGAPGRHRATSLDRAVPVPCHGPGWRPKPVLVARAGPAWARWPPCRAVLRPGQNAGPWARPRARGLHGHLYSPLTPLLLAIPTSLFSSSP